MPNLVKRGGVWHYSFTVAGRRIRKSAETADRDIAEEVALRHERRQRRALVFGPEAELTFAEAVDLYIDRKPSARYILPLLDHFGPKTKVAAIDPPAVRRAARALYPAAGPATWNRQVVTPVRAVINLAAEDGLCRHFRMKRFAEGDAVERPAGDKAWLAALARFMFETGARIGQSCRLTWDDVDLAAGQAVLSTRKTGATGPETRERTAWLTPAMVAEIANFAERHPRLVFGYAGRHSLKAWNNVCKAAGIRRLTPHEAGRHGFATEMVVRAGKDVATTAERGGWRSKRLLLERYAHGEKSRAVIDDVFGGRPKRGRNKA